MPSRRPWAAPQWQWAGNDGRRQKGVSASYSTADRCAMHMGAPPDCRRSATLTVPSGQGRARDLGTAGQMWGVCASAGRSITWQRLGVQYPSSAFPSRRETPPHPTPHTSPQSSRAACRIPRPSPRRRVANLTALRLQQTAPDSLQEEIDNGQATENLRPVTVSNMSTILPITCQTASHVHEHDSV